jgi:ubiquinone/menaquinone biosynthesis C-methylase UbiE
LDRQILSNYNTEEGARSYRDEYRNKVHRKLSDRSERRLFERLFALTGPLESLLDVPCGVGRLHKVFVAHAARVVEADWSFHMLRENRSDHPDGRTPFVRADGLRLPFRDRAFDCVASIRLNHHIDDPAERERHPRELMRVADRYVLFTYFSYHLLKNWLRRLRRPLNRKLPKNTLRTARVAELAEAGGFDLRASRPLSVLGSGHHFALLARKR